MTKGQVNTVPSYTLNNKATRHRSCPPGRVGCQNNALGENMSDETERSADPVETATGTPKATPTNPDRYRHATVSAFARPAWAAYSSGLDDAEATVEHAAAVDIRDSFLASEEPTTIRLAVNDCMSVAADGTITVERSEPTIEFGENTLSLAASARMARAMVKLVAEAIGDGDPLWATGAEAALDALDAFVAVVEDETGRAATEQEVGR